MTAGDQVRDYMHIDDTGRALALLCHRGEDGAINVASGQAVPLRQFAQTVAGLLGAAALLRLGELPTRPDEEMFMVADVRRLHSLGFRPEHSTLEDGLKATLQNWRTS
jgi:nucleoside-diphosphate-sugar epimerase